MDARPDIVVFDTADALADGAAERIAGFIRARSGDIVTVGLAGGSTPAATYRVLRGMDVPWDRVHAWVGDERFVPLDNPENNCLMVQNELIIGTNATFFPVPITNDPHGSAAEYESTLVDMLDHDAGGPIPDLLLAGIGDDGHTLSLFPDTDALDVTDRWFTANWVPQKNSWRLTATYPLAWRARQIYVLVSGSGKAAALSAIFTPGPTPLPAARLMEQGARVTWLVDADAASALGDLI